MHQERDTLTIHKKNSIFPICPACTYFNYISSLDLHKAYTSNWYLKESKSQRGLRDHLHKALPVEPRMEKRHLYDLIPHPISAAVNWVSLFHLLNEFDVVQPSTLMSTALPHLARGSLLGSPRVDSVRRTLPIRSPETG